MLQQAAQIRGLGELIVVGLATSLGSASPTNHTNEVKQKQKGVLRLGGGANLVSGGAPDSTALASSGRGQQAFLLGLLLLGLRARRRLLLL